MIQSLNTDTDDLMDPKRRAKDKLDGVEEEEVSWRRSHVMSVHIIRPPGDCESGIYLMDILFAFSILLV